MGSGFDRSAASSPSDRIVGERVERATLAPEHGFKGQLTYIRVRGHVVQMSGYHPIQVPAHIRDPASTLVLGAGGQQEPQLLLLLVQSTLQIGNRQLAPVAPFVPVEKAEIEDIVARADMIREFLGQQLLIQTAGALKAFFLFLLRALTALEFGFLLLPDCASAPMGVAHTRLTAQAMTHAHRR